MTRGDKKRLIRAATAERIRAERAALIVKGSSGQVFDLNTCALSEIAAIERLKNVPSVFAFAEKMNRRYTRPAWADQRYGAK